MPQKTIFEMLRVSPNISFEELRVAYIRIRRAYSNAASAYITRHHWSTSSTASDEATPQQYLQATLELEKAYQSVNTEKKLGRFQSIHRPDNHSDSAITTETMHDNSSSFFPELITIYLPLPLRPAEAQILLKNPKKLNFNYIAQIIPTLEVGNSFIKVGLSDPEAAEIFTTHRCCIEITILELVIPKSYLYDKKYSERNYLPGYILSASRTPYFLLKSGVELAAHHIHSIRALSPNEYEYRGYLDQTFPIFCRIGSAPMMNQSSILPSSCHNHALQSSQRRCLSSGSMFSETHHRASEKRREEETSVIARPQ